MKIFLAFVAMISFAVAANLLMKTGAISGRDSGGTWLTQFVNWRIIAGLACFGVGSIFYIFALRWLPLNIAQSFASAQFIAVVLAAAVVLSEPISPLQWVGIILIASGIVLIGWSRV